MKLQRIVILFILTLNLVACKNLGQETKMPIRVSQFDFSSKANIRESKLKGTIVSDFDGVFDQEQKASLTKLLYDYQVRTTREIVVFTVPTIQPYDDVVKYANDLGRYLGVGSKESDNGLVIVFSKSDRKIGIASGTGTQLILTNEICKNVIDSVMIPEFKNDNYYLGIKNGIIELMDMWE